MKTFIEHLEESSVAYRPVFVPEKGKDLMDATGKAPLSPNQHYAVMRARQGLTAQAIADEMETTSKHITTLHGEARKGGWHVPYEMNTRKRHEHLRSKIHSLLNTTPSTTNFDAFKRLGHLGDDGQMKTSNFRKVFAEVKASRT